jgi:pimeloyl-ACP methyl ester carboxylesterase
MNTMKLLTLLVLLGCSSMSFAKECVILLHGLARTANSMSVLADELSEAGFSVANISYPSREQPIAELAEIAVTDGLGKCAELQASSINFVTHSLGGILVRFYVQENPDLEINRVVMLGPPNNGSEVVDNLKDVPGYELLNGPAGMQLGTSADDIPKMLGAVNFELGIIAGTRSINLILSTLLPNTDDGKVTLESAKVEGMTDFIALPVTHTMMMRNEEVIEEVLNFLRDGRFNSESAISNSMKKL